MVFYWSDLIKILGELYIVARCSYIIFNNIKMPIFLVSNHFFYIEL